MTIAGVFISNKARAGTAILEACKQTTSPEPKELGSYMGFPLYLSFVSFLKEYSISIRGVLSHEVELGSDVHGNIARLNNALDDMPRHLRHCEDQLKTLLQQLENAKQEVGVPFAKDTELQIKSARLAELNVLLNMDKTENEVLGEEPCQAEQHSMEQQLQEDDGPEL